MPWIRVLKNNLVILQDHKTVPTAHILNSSSLSFEVWLHDFVEWTALKDVRKCVGIVVGGLIAKPWKRNVVSWRVNWVIINVINSVRR